MITCDCIKYGHLELNNTSIYRRIQESKLLRNQLVYLATSNNPEHMILRCSVCGQLWQASRAALWGNNPYCFKVPELEIQDWVSSPFIPPDELVEYNKSIQGYKSTQTFNPSKNECKYEGCGKSAIELSVMCLQHHMQRLQIGGALAAKPKGQICEPYDYQEEEMIYLSVKVS